MKKIVSDVLIVGVQLMIGGLFLWGLFSDNNENNKIVVAHNDNLNKMADSVSALFTIEENLVEVIDETKEVELSSVEEVLEEEVVEEVIEEVEVVESEPVEVVVEPEPEPEPIVTVDPSGYISNSAVGFNVTTGNKTYSLNDDEFYVVAAVVTCEANRASKDDILGVISVILNRADSYGSSPVDVVAAPGQFSCYNYYTRFTPTNVVTQTVNDALNGIRNNNYYGFNSWTNTAYSNNYIVDGGNRYR